MPNGVPASNNGGGLASQLLTTYRGLVTVCLIFAAGAFASNKWGAILDIPSQSEHNLRVIDSLGLVDTRLIHQLNEISDKQTDTYELLLDVVCSNPDTLNKRECRNR